MFVQTGFQVGLECFGLKVFGLIFLDLSLIFCQTPTQLGTQSERTWTSWVRSWLCFPMTQEEEEQPHLILPYGKSLQVPKFSMTKNFSWPKIFRDQKFLVNKNLSGPKFFRTHNAWDQNFFETQNFWRTNFFEIQNSFDLKFLGPKIFLDQKFVGTQKFLGLKLFWD